MFHKYAPWVLLVAVVGYIAFLFWQSPRAEEAARRAANPRIEIGAGGPQGSSADSEVGDPSSATPIRDALIGDAEGETRGLAPAGYSWKGPAKRTFLGLREPSADERAITLEYFRISMDYVGAFPEQYIDARNAAEIAVTRSGVPVDAASLGPSVPRFDKPDLAKQIDAALDRGVATADKPSLIFRDMQNVGCMPGSRIQRVSAGAVDWVFVFRKNSDFFEDPYLFNEIGLIASNRETGRTAFFAGTGSVRFRIESEDWPAIAGAPAPTSIELAVLTGKQVPPPRHDNPESVRHWALPMGGAQGGSCIECHSAGPFVSFPFTDFAGYDGDGKPSYYEQADGRRVVPARTPTMLYEPLNYLTNPDFRAFMQSYQPVDEDDPFYRQVKKELERRDPFVPKRLVDPRAKDCTVCHHIGNGAYSQRFPDAAFFLKPIAEDPELGAERGKRYDRSYLNLVNTTPSFIERPNTSAIGDFMHANRAANGEPVLFPMLGFHNRKVTLEDELGQFKPKTVDAYQGALAAIREMANDPAKAEWDAHWTLERVRAQPLEYLRAACSSCHDGSDPMLTRLHSKADFQAGGRSHFRIENADLPMPPSGQLQPSVRAILVDYLSN